MRLAQVRTYIFLALAAFAGDTARVCAPIDPPPRISSNSSTPMTKNTQLSADADMDTIMESLDSLDAFREFLNKVVIIEYPSNVVEFLRTWRQSPEHMRQVNEEGETIFSGPCNNATELHGRWALQHGGKPYVVSLCPIGILSKIRENSHQILICKIDKNHLAVFNNDDVMVWEGTFENYLKVWQPCMTVAPIGGVVPWTGTLQDSARAKILDHIQWNTKEADFEIAPLPRQKPESKPSSQQLTALAR